MVWLLFVGLLFLIGVAIIVWCNNNIKINTVVINSEKVKRDFDIVFVSDFHVGRFMKRKELKKLISLINTLDGDYLFIGGDMVGRNPLKYYENDELWRIFDSLRIKSRYFVGGNHDDYSLSLYHNFNVLNNECVVLEDGVVLIGLAWKKGECLDYKLDRNNYNILLSHYPDRVMEYSKLDLALGAHSHGLQVNVPFLRFHHKEKYTRGLYLLDNDTSLYVNRGLGFSLFKIRFLSTREIVKIKIRKC